MDYAWILEKYKLVRLGVFLKEHTISLNKSQFLQLFPCLVINNSLEISTNPAFPFNLLLLSPKICNLQVNFAPHSSPT